MLASLCVEAINKLFNESKGFKVGWFLECAPDVIAVKSVKKYDDEQLNLQIWQQIYRYFQSADSSTIRRIVESYTCTYFGNESVLMIPLKIQMGILKFSEIHTVDTLQTIKFLKSMKKKDADTIVEVDCHYYLDCFSMFSNLKVLKLGQYRSDDEPRCLSRECPLLEKLTWYGGFTDIGLDYLGDLTKLKELSVCGLDLTTAGAYSFLKKSRTVLELFKHSRLYDAVDVLASQNEVLNSMKYFECPPSKLATALKVFPCIKSLILNISYESIDDFIKLQHTIKTNYTVKHLHIYWSRQRGLSESSDAYNHSRSLSIIFPQITSLTFRSEEDYELFSYVDAEVDLSLGASTPLFRSVTRLYLKDGFTTGMLQTWFHPGNNVKYLEIWDTETFRYVDFEAYLPHLTELVEICLKNYKIWDCKLINRIVKLFPNLSVFRIDGLRFFPKALETLRLNCSSDNRYGIKFFVNNYSL